jgi:hypothetical protein
MNNEFEIVIASLPDNENLVAEIYYQNVYWVQISKEGELAQIQFYSHPHDKCWKFSLEEALTILEKAKKRFLEMQVPRSD